MQYKRLTKWETSKGVRCVKYWQYSQEQIAERLALLEDKIERGELVDVKENHLIAISRTNGKSSKQLEAIEILTKYENGTLIELPCKVGDTVYVLDTDKISDKPKISEAIVADYNISSYDYSILVYEKKYSYYLWNCGLGFDWFTTKAEAEQKLKELEE